MEWIDVNVELPKDQQVVLICSKQWGTSTGIYDGDSWRDSEFNDTYGYAILIEEVTHWMPLPEPPYSLN